MEQEVKKKKPTKLIVIGVIAVIVVVIGAVYFVGGTAYETSDNAQLDGDIVPVRSSVTAYINGIRFKDNQLIKKGDTLIIFDADELKAKVMQAEAALDNANANLLSVGNRASASVENANASQETVQSNQESIVASKVKLDKAQKDLDRII
jgi:membrane fusion protein (multidrug efflux system)